MTPTLNLNHRIPRVYEQGQSQFIDTATLGIIVPSETLAGLSNDSIQVGPTVEVTKENSLVVIVAVGIRIDATASGGTAVIKIKEGLTVFATKNLFRPDPTASVHNIKPTTLLHVITNPTVDSHTYSVEAISDNVNFIISGIAIQVVVIEPE